LTTPLSVAQGGTGETTVAGIAGAISATFYVATIADLRALTSATTATTASVSGYATAADGGGGIFVVDAADTTSADNGGTIIVDAASRRWKLQYAWATTARQWGCKMNGAAGTDAARLNAAIAWVNSIGGGVIELGEGVLVAEETIVLYSFVQLRGAGQGATIIEAAPATTFDVVQTYDFAALTGSNTSAGPYKWGLYDLSIDGNAANRTGTTTARCIAIYGYDFDVHRCNFYNSPGDNWYSEWSSLAAVPVAGGGDGMEARVSNCKFFDSANGNGMKWSGPHDSMIDKCLFFLNALCGYWQTGAGSAAIRVGMIHAYGNKSIAGLQFDTQVDAHDIVSESNAGFGVSLGDAPHTIGLCSVYNNTAAGIALPSNVTNAIIFGQISSTNNGDLGISQVGNNFSVGNAFVQSNGNIGVTYSNGATGVLFRGYIANNGGASGVQVAFNTLGSGNIIDQQIFTSGSQVATSGTPGTNFIRSVSTGVDTSVINTVA
jgi:hypothetical protein